MRPKTKEAARDVAGMVAVALVLLGLTAGVIALAMPAMEREKRARAECEAVPGHAFVTSRYGAWCVGGTKR